LDLKRLLRRLFLGLVNAMPAALCYVLRIRLLMLAHPERIGHLCTENADRLFVTCALANLFIARAHFFRVRGA
jgi:hypothetical protein